MSLDVIAVILWSLLGLSIALTIYAAWTRSWRPMALAAVFAGIFGIAALPSIGLFVLPVALAQGVMAVLMARRGNESTTRTP